MRLSTVSSFSVSVARVLPASSLSVSIDAAGVVVELVESVWVCGDAEACEGEPECGATGEVERRQARRVWSLVGFGGRMLWFSVVVGL